MLHRVFNTQLQTNISKTVIYLEFISIILLFIFSSFYYSIRNGRKYEFEAFKEHKHLKRVVYSLKLEKIINTSQFFEEQIKFLIE